TGGDAQAPPPARRHHETRGPARTPGGRGWPPQRCGRHNSQQRRRNPMTSHVLLSREDNLAVLTLHKPESRNALGAEMQEELIDHLEALGRDPGCGAIVLTGHGEHFCSGGDLNNMRAERTLAFSRDKMAVGARIARADRKSTRLNS